MKDVVKEMLEDLNGELSVNLKDGEGVVSVKVKGGGVHCLTMMVTEMVIAFHDWLEKNTEYSDEEIKSKLHELLDISFGVRESRKKINALKKMEEKAKQLACKAQKTPEDIVDLTNILLEAFLLAHGKEKEVTKENGH